MLREMGAQKAAGTIAAQQHLSGSEKALLAEIYERLEIFRAGCDEMHEKAREARRIALLDDPFQDPPGTPAAQKTLQLQTLKSTLNNCVADQMDNMPDVTLAPEKADLAQAVEDMTDVVRFVLERNHYETLHKQRVEDYFITGTAVTQITWDDQMDGGIGNVALLRWPIEAFLWDPIVENIQDARALIKVSWHPLSWYAAHYPEAAPYIRSEEYAHEGIGVPDAWQKSQMGDEGRAMMLEYWYRKYDAQEGRYVIHVAHAAGGALLESSEREAPEGVFTHGMYPFVLDVFTPIEGVPVGVGMVQELVPMMRYINRYAHYIDENLRMSAKTRLLVRRDAQIDHLALMDWQQNVIEGGNIDEDAVRWMRTAPLSNLVTGQMLQMQTDIKQDSGQNQFTRGETVGGVTAASAIVSLQEAGGRLTRLRTGILNEGLARIAEQIIWLVSEFYSPSRTQQVTGREGKLQEKLWKEQATDSPLYSVRIEVQRRNPLRVHARNELYMQAYTLAAQSGTPMPVSTLFELLDIDGKERALTILHELERSAKEKANGSEQ